MKTKKNGKQNIKNRNRNKKPDENRPKTQNRLPSAFLKLCAFLVNKIRGSIIPPIENNYVRDYIYIGDPH
jgi:hypothetical protein